MNADENSVYWDAEKWNKVREAYRKLNRKLSKEELVQFYQQQGMTEKEARGTVFGHGPTTRAIADEELEQYLADNEDSLSDDIKEWITERVRMLKNQS